MRPRWCIRYDSTRNSWLVNLTGTPCDRHLCAARIERQRSAADFSGELSAGTANQPAQARDHFLHPERLRHVVVGAAVDSLNLLMPAATRGQDENRKPDARLAPAAQNGEAIHLRQTEIEDRGVVVLGLPQEFGALAVLRAVDDVAGVGQGRSQLPRQRGFVFSDQDFHGPSLFIAQRAEPCLNACSIPQAGLLT